MLKKLSVIILALTLMACSDDKPQMTPVSGEKYAEGVHYTLVKSPLPVAGDKIVVTEFFWYGCPHCEHFEPMLELWDKQKPADVVLVKSPAVWREPMKLHAKLFYLAQTLPNRDFVHSALFGEVIARREEANIDVQNQAFAIFLSKLGVSEKDYHEKMQSSDINAKVEEAVALMQQAGISGTPAIMVNGKYLVNNQAVGSMEEILAIADFLIAKERQAAAAGGR